MRQYNMIQTATGWAVIDNENHIVYEDDSFEYAEAMLEECRYYAKAESDFDLFNNQESEFDYV